MKKKALSQRCVAVLFAMASATAGSCASVPPRERLPPSASADPSPTSYVPCDAAIRRAAVAGLRVFRETEVGEPAALIFENRGPKYPPSFEMTGTAASVETEFVVDSTGRADMTTFGLLQPVPASFVESVRDFLLTARFTLARVGGHPVAMCVKQRFEFRTRSR